MLTIQGNYTQATAGSLDIELGGPVAGTQYDQLNVTGTATLDGTLNVSALHGFAPGIGATFQVLGYSPHSGQFASIMFQGFPGSTNLSANYNANDLTLTTASAALSSIAVTPANPTIAKGLTQQFTATGTFSDGTTQDLTSPVTWASATPSVGDDQRAPGLASGAGDGHDDDHRDAGERSSSPATTLTVTARDAGRRSR